MLRSIKGKSWGASSKLILTTYKVLVRSIFEYAPFTIINMSKTNQNKIEGIQRTAMRIATYWPVKVSAKEMYQRVKLEPTTERAYKLSDKYICKSHITNTLINQYINDYKIAPELNEGAHAKGLPRKTILGKLKDKKDLKSYKVLT